MKLKNTLIIGFTASICFALGMLTATRFQKASSKHKDKLVTSNKQGVDTLSEQTFQEAINIDFSKLLRGKYILKGAEYAGFEFVDKQTLTWTNEMFPMYPDTMRLVWINTNTFVGTFTEETNENCPPNVWINQVVSLEGKKLKLQEINTGWRDTETETHQFIKDE